MFQLNQQYRNTQAPDSSNAAQLNAVSQSIKNLNDIGSEYRAKERVEKEMDFRAKAATIQHSNALEIQAQDQAYKIKNMNQQHSLNKDIAEIKFGNDSKVTKLAAELKNGSDKLRMAHEFELEKVKSSNQLIRDDFAAQDKMAYEKLRAVNDKKLELLKEEHKKDKLPLNVAKQVKEAGGLEKMVKNALIDAKSFLAGEFTEESQTDLEAVLLDKLQDKDEWNRFQLDPTKYTTDIMKEEGVRDWTFKFGNLLPFGESPFQDTWTPKVKGQ